MNGDNQLSLSEPCWEGIAVGGDISRSCLDGGTLGRKRDVPHSLRLHSNRGNTGSIFVSEEEPASLSSIRSDSRLNSLEYWDYALELECMQGSQDTCNVADTASDLQNKNRDLEEVVKFQQDTIQDQAMRIEVPNKRTCNTFVYLINIIFSIFVVRRL